jgi:hypothetical protein
VLVCNEASDFFLTSHRVTVFGRNVSEIPIYTCVMILIARGPYECIVLVQEAFLVAYIFLFEESGRVDLTVLRELLINQLIT